MRRGSLVLVVFLTVAGSLHAQTPPWKYQWQKGQVLTYRVEHVTAITDVVSGNKVESKARTTLVKRWQVDDVDAQGIATLTLTLASLRNEQTRPGGDVLIFDSTLPDKSTPELREAMGKFVGQTLAILRVNSFGSVVEVKKGDAAQYESDPPFTLVLPAVAPQANQSWSRPIALATRSNEKVEALQRFNCKAVTANASTISVATTFKTPPANTADQVPLLQKLSAGEIVFDPTSGRMRSVALNIDQTLTNHQGEGSNYHLVSSYREELVGQ